MVPGKLLTALKIHWYDSLVWCWRGSQVLECLNYVCVLSCSVISDPLWLCGHWPTRLLCPWASPGKNTGMSWVPSSRGSSQPRDWTLDMDLKSVCTWKISLGLPCPHPYSRSWTSAWGTTGISYPSSPLSFFISEVVSWLLCGWIYLWVHTISCWEATLALQQLPLALILLINLSPGLWGCALYISPVKPAANSFSQHSTTIQFYYKVLFSFGEIDLMLMVSITRLLLAKWLI